MPTPSQPLTSPSMPHCSPYPSVLYIYVCHLLSVMNTTLKYVRHEVGMWAWDIAKCRHSSPVLAVLHTVVTTVSVLISSPCHLIKIYCSDGRHNMHPPCKTWLCPFIGGVVHIVGSCSILWQLLELESLYHYAVFFSKQISLTAIKCGWYWVEYSH